MYTSKTTSSGLRPSSVTIPISGRSVEETGSDGGTIPLQIPPEYHGEMLRITEPAEPYTERIPSAREPAPVSEPIDAHHAASDSVSLTAAPLTTQMNTHSLLNGIFDLLLGKNSDEEETILLLGVAVLLLSGHMDRRRDSSSRWDEDDLALLLIGYLLLG